MSDFFASQADYDRLVALVGPKEAARRLRRSGAEVRPNDIEFSAINAMGDGGEDGMENDGTDFAVAGEDAADNNANDGVNLAVGPKADAYADWERRNAAFMEKARAQRLAQFNNAKAYIEQNYRGPGLSEQLFAISQALLSPRKMPGFSGTLANISPVFTQIAKARRTAAQERAEALMKLQQQYQSGELEAQGDILKNELALMRARAAAGKKTGAMPTARLGQDMRIRHSKYGTEIKLPVPEDIDELQTYLSDPDVSEDEKAAARREFDGLYGYGASEIYGE